LKVRLTPDDLQRALNQDPEFRLQARYWDGSLRFEFGDDIFWLRLKDGEVKSVETKGDAKPGIGDVVVSAPVSDWGEMLQPIPRPFYQDFYPALTHHSFKVEGDPDYIWPYYAAIRRSGQVLRAIATIEGK
jgi:hypothetical protein